MVCDRKYDALALPKELLGQLPRPKVRGLQLQLEKSSRSAFGRLTLRPCSECSEQRSRRHYERTRIVDIGKPFVIVDYAYLYTHNSSIAAMYYADQR